MQVNGDAWKPILEHHNAFQWDIDAWRSVCSPKVKGFIVTCRIWQIYKNLDEFYLLVPYLAESDTKFFQQRIRITILQSHLL